MTEQELTQRISDLEEKYYEAFCSRQTEAALTRYEDLQIGDMYTHNFTGLKTKLTPEELLALIDAEKARRIKEGKDFLMIRLPYRVDPADLPEELRPGLGIMEYYQLTEQAVAQLPEREEVEVIQLSDFLLDEARELDELCDDGESKDFSKRRFERRSRVYLSEEGPDQYLALLDWMAVGTCDYFAADGACMLEDLIVDPIYRQQGIGTTLLKTLATHAFQDGHDLVFLTADHRESARDMYIKLGFPKVWECSELLIKGISQDDPK